LQAIGIQYTEKAMRDEPTYKTLITANKDTIYRLCCAYVKDSEERKDVFQEILVHIWDGLPSYKGEARASTWIQRIAINTCLGWIRTEKRRSQRVVTAAPEVLDNIHVDATPNTDKDESMQQLYACINSLRPVDRVLIALYLEELDTAQMAVLMGLSEGNVRVKIHRIKNELKQLWMKKGYGH
jgi:RNA polymerase sigma factor (sigma-70 family)